MTKDSKCHLEQSECFVDHLSHRYGHSHLLLCRSTSVHACQHLCKTMSYFHIYLCWTYLLLSLHCLFLTISIEFWSRSILSSFNVVSLRKYKRVTRTNPYLVLLREVSNSIQTKDTFCCLENGTSIGLRCNDSKGIIKNTSIPSGSQTEQPVHVGWDYLKLLKAMERASSLSLSPSIMHTSPVCWGQLLKPQFPHLYNENNDIFLLQVKE